MEKINSFRGKFFFLSNMYPCKVTGTFIAADGRCFDANFKCSEAMFQALKASKLSDFLKFTEADGPSAKKMGRTVKMDLKNWESRKLDEMRFAVESKFFNNKELAAKLLATGDAELVEENTWGDRYWGVCNGKGENHLGIILMETRKKLQDLKKDGYL